jgi:hypothetical protein
MTGRPKTVDDLPDFKQGPIEIVSVNLAEAIKWPGFAADLLHAAENAQAEGTAIIVVDGQLFKVVRAKTEEELAASLKVEQDQWDRAEKHYRAWRTDSKHLPPKYAYHTVRRHYRAYDLDSIPEIEKYFQKQALAE